MFAAQVEQHADADAGITGKVIAFEAWGVADTTRVNVLVDGAEFGLELDPQSAIAALTYLTITAKTRMRARATLKRLIARANAA